LLDEVGDDIQQQNLIAQWFEQLGESAIASWMRILITKMTARAAMRKAEDCSGQELASSNERTARSLKDRLKWFFETHGLKTIETPAKLQLAKNGGKAPLILDDLYPSPNFQNGSRK